MKYVSLIGRAAAVSGVLAIAAGAVTAGPPPAPPPLPAPKILIVDKSAVLERSAVGQSIMKQVQSLAVNARKNLQAREAALRAEGTQLQQQLTILSASVKAAKVKAFEAKQVAFQRDVQNQQAMIQGGLQVARDQVLQAMGPILQKIVVERGANILIDRGAVIVSANGFDVTPLAIARLNQVMPNVTVKPAMPQAGPQ